MNKHANKSCVVVIPAYSENLDEFERASLRQVVRVLGDEYDLYFVCPDSLNLRAYEMEVGKDNLPEAFRLPEYYFRNRKTYSEMCESPMFYERFAEYGYMLLYQLDSWVFENRLQQFCDTGYDYFGAPHRCLITGEPVVGNGGLSLRKISTFIEKCKVLDFSIGRWEEDRAFCDTYRSHFKFPPLSLAYDFSIQNLRMDNHLPFGCHAPKKFFWNGFWKGKIDLNPLVSIIIPCYNDAEYVAEAIASVKSQTYNNWECIIVNDGSTDNSEEVILPLLDNRFKYLKQENKGVSAARNFAIKSSRGKYILPLDADDMIWSSYVSVAVATLEANPSASMFFGAEWRFGLCKQGINKHIGYFGYENLLKGNTIYDSAVFKRYDFDRVGGYREDLKCYEDWELWIRLLYRNDNVIFDKDFVTLYYRQGIGTLRYYAELHKQEICGKIRDINKQIYEEHHL